MKELEKGVRIRIRLIGVIFTIGFSLVTMRAFDLQVLQEEQWHERAVRQHQKPNPTDAHSVERSLTVMVKSWP